ncbi:molybdopterin molybdotransferase MoeA [Flavobacteriaceae bacterium S356]|uniref:Molybdopterin molybdenumtransferase n=1 Tax=Asprobacillus argus TaxID=3076534 RepID=A0ABU3LG51_9FLAO|nr:molybdopterin molybdotransferase MoeA [Flavobacteriaceae bacterium S356]
MISVQEALQTILNNTQDFGVEEIPFLKSVGRVLKEDILADRDFPPFNRVAMDGIAINHRFFEQGIRDFKVEGVQAAGAKQKTMSIASNCIEVMTGAVLPENTDTVIRYEDVAIENGTATIQLDTLEKGKNIHTKGKDRNQGDVLVVKNTRITAAEIGVIATVGKSTVKVAKTPRIMIVSTGDELVEVNEIPEAHQIRRSNAFTLVALLEELKIKAETAHITDDKEQLKEKIGTYLEEYDALLFSGAVSKGKFDYLPEVLEELGVEKLFHRVAQRPGKPFWYGIRNEKSVFAFPGNPISTYVNCLAYFYPWFAKSSGFELKEETVILGGDVSFKPSLAYFLQVRIEVKYGHLVAIPVKGNGSGDLASLVRADGFIRLPKEQTELKKGETYPFIRYRN